MKEDKSKTVLTEKQLDQATGGAQHHVVPVYAEDADDPIAVCTYCGAAKGPHYACPNCGNPYFPPKKV
ncbi:MAG: 50S ribosomal protein L32 [Christensenellaceae bacterium]|jgi:ribosomal protein L32